MYKSKKFSYGYKEYEEGDKSSETMVADILADPEFAELEEVVIGDWGNAWDYEAQDIIDDIIENKEQFSHIKSLFIGDMDFEECEVSWIIQGNYENLFSAMPQLESLTIKGSTGLALGKVEAPNLQSLEIICGGLPKEVIQSVRDANLPALKSLTLYIGVEDYGFDGSIKDIEELLEKSDFPALENLALVDSQIQNEICKAVLDSKYMKQINRLELSMGSLTNKGGQILLDKLLEFPNVKTLDVHYHFLSDEMMEKLEALPIEVNTDEQNGPENDEIDCWPMLTE
ncbi:MAG: cytoplasmic protein [Clostridiales bacterium]|nr:cytoplasmic protein [Clostridiales bacterium]